MLNIQIIIPCYNEFNRLNTKEFSSFLSKEKNQHISFLFVNDGSQDNTIDLLKELASKFEKVSFINLEENVGKAEAIRQGVLHSKNQQFDYIGYFDADLAAPLDEIINLSKTIKDEDSPYIILGTRVKLLGNTQIKRKIYRHFIGRIFATIVSFILKIPVYDTQCGAKLIRKDIAEEIFKEHFISKWLFDVEILFRINRKFKNSLSKIIEVPLNRWEDKSGSKIKPTYFLKAPIDLLAIYFSNKKNSKSKRSNSTYNKYKSYILGFFLLIIASWAGISNYQKYGLSWDEPTQRNIGKITYEYVFEGNQKLLSFIDRDYGVAIELPLYAIERIFRIEDSKDVYLMRHLVCHFLFLLAAYCLFILVSKLYKSTFLASSAFLMLVCHPRIYAHSFFNSKDVPFLSLMIISFLLLYLVINSSKKTYLVLFAIVCGLLINSRIIGFMVPLFYFGYTGVIAIKQKSIRPLINSSVLLSLTALTLYITWPYLWKNPIENFVLAIKNMSSFRWNSYIMFFGEKFKSGTTPWYYLPVYIFITTPLVFTLLFGFGIITSTIQIIKAPFSKKSILLILSLGVFIAPLLAVTIFKSTVYDGWRQFFFLYVPIVLVSINGLEYLHNKLPIKYVKNGFYATIIVVVLFMINLHPYQNVYFNPLFAFRENNYLIRNFDVDYWGTSYKESLEYLYRYTNSNPIKYFSSSAPGHHNILMLTEKQKPRFQYKSKKGGAEYLITDFRYNPNGFPNYKENKVYEIRRLNSTINAVYKVK